MYGKEYFDSMIGKQLTDGAFQLLMRNEEVIDQINVIFLKFDEWIRIVTTDESVSISSGKDSIEDYHKDEFYFIMTPIGNVYPDFEKFKGLNLKGVEEIKEGSLNRISMGVKLLFDENKSLCLINHDYPDDKTELILS